MSEQLPADAHGGPLSSEEEISLRVLINRLRSDWRIGQRVNKKRVEPLYGPPSPPAPSSLPHLAPMEAGI